MHISKPQRTEIVPYSGRPKQAFYTISLKAKQHSKLSEADFFEVRTDLLPFLLTHQVKVTFPFGFTNRRHNCLMVCFEATPKLKPLVDELCFNTLQLTSKYRMSLHFAEI